MLRVFSSSDAVRSGGVSAHERVGTGAAGCRISDVGSKVKARSMIGRRSSSQTVIVEARSSFSNFLRF